MMLDYVIDPDEIDVASMRDQLLRVIGAIERRHEAETCADSLCDALEASR